MTTNAFGTLTRQEQCEKTPRVAVLCHVYNGEQYLDEMIQSVLTQTFTEFEFLILDDGSTDRTKAIVSQYQQDQRLRYVYQDNIGRSGNAFHTILNRCVAHTTAELLCFIGADDVFLPQKLAIQVSRFDQDRSVDLVFSDGYHINAQGRILASDFHFDEALTFTRRSLLRTLFSKNIVAHPTVMVTRRAVERLGGFETGFCPDYQFWLKASRQLHFAYIADKLIKYRVHVQGVSTGRNNKTTPETVRLLADTRVRYTIDDLYPEIADCHDQALARYSAHLHFGNVLMTANIPVPGLALAEYRDALAAKPNGVAALNNAAIALTMLGDTKQIATCLALMRVHGGHIPTVQKNLLTLQQRTHIGCVLFCETSAESDLIQKLDPPMLADRSHGSPPGGIGGIMPLSVESMQTAPMSSSCATSSVNQQVPATNGERPLVSVIVPTHNRPAMLTEAVRSILAQTYPEIEIIVVNDAGTDVEHVVASLNETRRISYVRHGTNRGLAAARNTALKIARGKYIAYLDDDDRFHPDHIETLVGVLEGNDYRVAYTDAWRVHYEKRENGYVATGRDLPYSFEFNANYLLISNMFPVLTVMHERACLDQCGLFDESLTSHEDWDLWIRLSRTFPFLHVKKTTAEFSWRTDGSTMTSGKKDDFPRTTRLIYEKYRLFSAAVPGLAAAQATRLAELSAQQSSGAFQCSIIIPVYNRAELTRQCLTALAAVTEGASYEVIFVDNGSTDETAALLDSLGGDVRVVRNTDNLGFAKACNQGAAIAKSRYLVFLNNDTVPVSGWLTPLLHEVETHAEVAVVGSKLLYADDTIQHAGVAFSRDWFTPYHLYKGFPRDSAAVSRRREFQCVTAACMLVRKDMFDAVQGFDEGYRNGFEDVDLCLKIRAQGGKIIYQPQSVLYHLESQTPGRKLHEEANSRRLVQRWGAHWWLPDDDLLRFEDGYAFHAFMENGSLRYNVEVLNDPLRKAQWQLVADVQSATHRHNRDLIGSLLTRADEWPADTYVLLWGASVCRHAGFADLAPRFWERILMIEEHAAARIGLARHALEAGKLHDADLHLSHLFTRQPRHGEGWLLRGILAMQREAYVEAGRAFQHALASQADARKARIGIAMAAIGLKQPDRAWEALTTVLQSEPDDTECLHWLIRAGTMLECWPLLADHLEQFLARNPADLSIRFTLCGVFLRLNRVDAARAECDRVRMLNPAYDGLDELEARLSSSATCLTSHHAA